MTSMQHWLFTGARAIFFWKKNISIGGKGISREISQKLFLKKCLVKDFLWCDSCSITSSRLYGWALVQACTAGQPILMLGKFFGGLGIEEPGIYCLWKWRCFPTPPHHFLPSYPGVIREEMETERKAETAVAGGWSDNSGPSRVWWKGQCLFFTPFFNNSCHWYFGCGYQQRLPLFIPLTSGLLPCP